MLLDKTIHYIAASSPVKIILLTTLFVLSSSIPIVYIFSYLFGEEYSRFLFYISVFLPLILTPVTISLLIRLTTRLAYVKKYLHDEIEKNKEKDIILFEQARFVLMGEMMANISHQWKQPLNTINLALLDMKLSNPESKNNNYDIIENNVNYLASTIDDFISFFDKRSHFEVKTLDAVKKEIHSIVDAHVMSKNIDLEVVIDEHYAKLSIASSISQVVLNLINNSKDALESIPLKRIQVKFRVTQSGLEIECCDSGCGIERSIKDKIFAPYFTTKNKKRGTGIGLYMSKEIICKIFDGKITCHSEGNSDFVKLPMKTCFLISIPYSKNCYIKEDRP